MLPPLTTRTLQAAIEAERRAAQKRRWERALGGERRPATDASRDIPTPQLRRR